MQPRPKGESVTLGDTVHYDGKECEVVGTQTNEVSGDLISVRLRIPQHYGSLNWAIERWIPWASVLQERNPTL